MRAEKLRTLRRASIQLVLGVVLLDAVALATYYGFDIAHAVRKTQLTFTVTWTIATALTVAFLLKRVRKARFR